MRPKIILHVGPHKTGSTYLQKRLTENRGHLEDLGVFIPSTGWGTTGHHQLVDVLRGWLPVSEECSLNALKFEISGHDLSLITSENFIFLNEQQLRVFRDLFRGYDIEVVFFLRHPANVWPSHWQELIKHGADTTFAEYMLCIFGLSSLVDVSPVMPRLQIRRLSEVFGIGSLKIISYENLLEAEEDFFEFFWRSILRKPDRAFAGDRELVNKSFAADHVEMVRQLNTTYLLERGQSPGTALRRAYEVSLRDRDPAGPFKAFVEEFRENAASLRLSSDLPIMAEIFEDLAGEFGSVIVNRHTDKQILKRPVGERMVTYGSRDWILRSGQSSYVREIYSKLVRDLNE
ncbi:hypothetical protein [Roseibium aggregatum]|uniref:Sulfotransferase domain-containing protein n=1 Tax=Roseibium aggregatum TaxID=187304 RepID=A0A939J4C6_9HYPH|nr:hypothetical protein [Roseibium aggregatum]MBN9670559.1 hypothetical protein [Roseibium aggregatum]